MGYYRKDAATFSQGYKSYEAKREGAGFFRKAFLDARHPVFAIARKKGVVIVKSADEVKKSFDEAKADAIKALSAVKGGSLRQYEIFPRGHILRALAPLNDDAVCNFEVDFEALRMRYKYPEDYSHVALARLMAHYLHDGVTKADLRVSIRGECLDFTFKPARASTEGVPYSELLDPLAASMGGIIYAHNGNLVFTMRMKTY